MKLITFKTNTLNCYWRSNVSSAAIRLTLQRSPGERSS